MIMKTKENINPHHFLPTALSLTATIVSLFAYALFFDGNDSLLYLRVALSALAPLALPLIGRIVNREFPNILGYMISIHIILASDFGIALDFYNKIDCWDLIMHGFFGLLAAAVAGEFIVIWCGDKVDPLGFCILILLSVLGAAAAWEIFEFCGDLLFGSDSQCVKAAIAAGTNPIADTMTDIIIAIPGALLWCLFSTLRRHNEKKSNK